MRVFLIVAAALALLSTAACSESVASATYVPEESEVLSFEGGSLFADLYASEAETFITWAIVDGDERYMFAAGTREDGTILLLSVYAPDSSSLQVIPADDWDSYVQLLGFPGDE